MISKPLLPWSKRQPGPDTSPQTGGLLPTLKHRASRLVLPPSDDDRQNASSPATTHYDTALANAVGNLHTAVNGMLSSRSSSVHRPPRSRPLSTSTPLVVELPAELPDSTLLGEASHFSSSAPVLTISTVKTAKNEDQQPKIQPVQDKTALDTLEPGAPKLVRARSILGIGSSYSLRRKKNHTDNTPIANATAQSERQEIKRNSSFTAAPMLRTQLDSDAVKSFAVVIQSDFVKSGSEISDQEAHISKGPIETTSSEPSPIATHNECIYELESNNTLQNHITSALKSQLDRSREDCESHVNPLKRWHSVQVASFETQARLYKERTNLQDTAKSGWQKELRSDESSHTHIRERIEKPAIKEPANSNTSSHCQSTGQQWPPRRSSMSPKTENLKPKPLGNPGRKTLNESLLFQPTLYEQDRAALQKQIDVLTAKLSNSIKHQRELKSALATTKRESADKTMHANKLAEKIQALQNTLVHIENRLEFANMKRLDAEEQLLAWRDHKSPFDLVLSKQPASTSTHQAALNMQINTGTSTDFPNSTAYASALSYLEKTTPAVLVTHIRELQTQAKKKDACVAGLETKLAQLQEKYDQLQNEHRRVAVQSDLQHELLRETRVGDKLIEQLRTAVINHESTIMENEQTIHVLRRQLEHHKLLLQAEIRRHAITKLYVAAEEHSLPELTSLAKRENIDSWMEKLHERLRRRQSETESKTVPDTPEATIESLRHEIDFYINEIILFKLDIKGYRRDIRKLKEMTAHRGSSQDLPDTELDSSDKKVAPSVESSFAPITPELDDFLGASPVMGHTDTVSRSEAFSTDTSPSIPLFERRTRRANDQLLELEIPPDFQGSNFNHSLISMADRVDSAFSPCSNGFQVSEHSTASVVPPVPGPCETPVAYMEPQSPAESLFGAESVLSTASEYFARSAPLSEGTLGSTTAPGVSVKAAEESPRKPAHIEPPAPTHIRGCSITRCAPTDAVPFTSQPDTTATSSTHIHSPVANTRPSREGGVLKAPRNTQSMLPASHVEAGVVPGPRQGWYRNLPSMLPHLRRTSASSIYSMDSYQNLAVGAKSEAPMRPGKV